MISENEKGARMSALFNGETKCFGDLRGLRSKFRRTLRVHADEFALASLVLELHEAFDEREERVVFSTTDVLSGLPLGSALTRDDVSTDDVLTTELLESKSFGFRIATVTG